MKVTVSFNTVKIVVPCGDGEKTVRELTQLATIRCLFKSGSWEVFNLNISFNSFQVQESHREAQVILGKRSQPQSKRGRHPRPR